MVAPTPLGAPARGASRGRLILLGLSIAFCALATIVFVAFLGWRIGPTPLAIGLIGAVLPVPVLVGCFIWLDRYQPAPMWIIVLCLLWGAGVATGGSYLVESLAARLGISDNYLTTLVAPFAEETLKALLPLALFAFYRKAFSGIVDGIVYCGISAVGFAMVENILYLGGRAFASEAPRGFAYGAFAAAATFVARIVLSGFAHPLFTSMTGIGLGIAVRSPRRGVRWVLPFAGLLLAMVLHGSWNGMAVWTQKEHTGYPLLYGYFAVFVPLFLLVVGLAIWRRSWEGRLTERKLPAYVTAGWFSPPEVAALGTLGRRLSALRWAKRVAGTEGQAAMRAYQYAATRLALLRDGLDRHLYQYNVDSVLAEEHWLLDSIDASRKVFAGRDPATPYALWNGSTYQIQFPDQVVRVVAPPPLPVVPVPFPLPTMLPPPPSHTPYLPPTPYR